MLLKCKTWETQAEWPTTNKQVEKRVTNNGNKQYKIIGKWQMKAFHEKL